MVHAPLLRTALKAELRPALIGRLRMADWIEMPEREFAREIKKIEQDPLFQKLFFGLSDVPGAIRRQRWPRSRMVLSFDEVGGRTASAGERAKVEDILEAKPHLIAMIRRLGREAFETYFLHSDEPLTIAEIACRTSLPAADVRKIHDMLLDIGTQAEFESPGEPSASRHYACLARVWTEDGEPHFEFFSPHWARGRYHIRYDLVEEWKRQAALLSSDERRKLPRLIKRIETVNLRQNTMFRILESLAKLQADFLTNKSPDRKRPISLRQLAYRLDLAPSTVSRALSCRSVILPWGKEVPLIQLVPGRRKVLREILSRWLEVDARRTDAALALRLREEYAIKVSRRTVNAVRNELAG